MTTESASVGLLSGPVVPRPQSSAASSSGRAISPAVASAAVPLDVNSAALTPNNGFGVAVSQGEARTDYLATQEEEEEASPSPPPAQATESSVPSESTLAALRAANHRDTFGLRAGERSEHMIQQRRLSDIDPFMIGVPTEQDEAMAKAFSAALNPESLQQAPPAKDTHDVSPIASSPTTTGVAGGTTLATSPTSHDIAHTSETSTAQTAQPRRLSCDDLIRALPGYSSQLTESQQEHVCDIVANEGLQAAEPAAKALIVGEMAARIGQRRLSAHEEEIKRSSSSAAAAAGESAQQAKEDTSVPVSDTLPSQASQASDKIEHSMSEDSVGEVEQQCEKMNVQLENDPKCLSKLPDWRGKGDTTPHIEPGQVPNIAEHHSTVTGTQPDENDAV
jgi:hypothetical protein